MAWNGQTWVFLHTVSYRSNICWCSFTTSTSSILHITNFSQQLEFLHQFQNSWQRRCFTTSEKTFTFTNCFSKIFTIFVVNLTILMLCWYVCRSIFIISIVLNCHLSKNDTFYHDSCQNSRLFKMKSLNGIPCICEIRLEIKLIFSIIKENGG